MKKFASLALAGALTLTLAAPALAADLPLLISTRRPVITVNGVALDTSKLPQADGIPLRAFVEADGGSATWYAEDNQSLFFIDGASISVDFATGAATVGDKSFQGVEAVEGVTFASAEVVDAMEGVSVTEENGNFLITTASADPMVQLARNIQEQTEMARGMKQTAAQMKEFYNLDTDNFTSVVAYMPMMISADAVIIGQVASGKMETAKTELEAIRAQIQRGFENYLPGPLELAKNGKIVTNGNYVMLIISADNDTAVDLFNSAVKEM